MADKKVRYSEPADFIPKSVRKELGLGEFAPGAKTTNSGKGSNGKSSAKKSK